jgi:hypothetical protein
MKNPESVLHGYLTDMAAVEQHIHEAVERQLKTEALSEYPEAHRVVEELRTTLERHLSTLRREIESGDGESVDFVEAVKKAVAGALGLVAGLYDKIRTDKVSRMIRDDYTATSLATVSYQMLHTTALGLKNDRVADMALNHLKDLTPILVQLSEIVCTVVAQELAREEKIFDGTVGERAINNTHEAWSSSWVRTPEPF